MAWHPFRNPGLKLAALALGTLLWFTVSGQQIERRLTVPVFYRNLPASLEMTGDSLDAVTIQVRGGENVLGSVQPGRDLFMGVDLAEARPGDNVLPLRIDQVTTSAGIKVLQVDPATVTLSLERSGTRTLPVRALLEGEIPRGFAITNVSIDPREVVVAGPESLLNDVAAAITERVVVAGQRTSFSRDVSVGVADAKLRLLQPVVARVSVTVAPAPPEQRMLEGVRIIARDLAPGRHAEIEPAGVELVLRGSPAALDALAADAVLPFVSAKGLEPGAHVLRVSVDLPSGITVAATQPATVTVRIR